MPTPEPEAQYRLVIDKCSNGKQPVGMSRSINLVNMNVYTKLIKHLLNVCTRNMAASTTKSANLSDCHSHKETELSLNSGS